jgi:23S rRNA (adenine2503-C2)-methyltransferase
MSEPVKIDIRQLSRDDLNAFFEKQGQPAFRARQVHQWLWAKGVTDFEAMLNLPKALREELSNHFTIRPIREDKRQQSSDGTIKYRFALHDGHLVEAVLIPVTYENRYTLCVSCQVGCSLTCSFCATGKMGRIRNLDASEIFDQVWQVNEDCQKIYGRSITNIVYMGMGEPLLAYRPVMESIALITDPAGLGFSPKRITVSTAGIAKMIRKLADDNPRVNLALSLHAPDDLKRNTIMPINEQNTLDVLMEALLYFYQKTQNRITYEYIAFDGFNDTIQDARNLAALTKWFPVRVNIIEYNPVAGVTMVKSEGDRLDAFVQELVDLGVTVTVRRSRGKDIDAACGQLANKD